MMARVFQRQPVVRQWRIRARSNDGTVIDYEEPFAGTQADAVRRAWIIWARTSYVVGARVHRDTYASLETWDESRHEYRMVREKRGAYPSGREAPGQS